MKKIAIILLFAAVLLTAVNIYIGMNTEWINPCNPDHSEIMYQDIAEAQMIEMEIERSERMQDR